MSLVYESASSLPIGVRNSIVSTTIESFEATCSERDSKSLLHWREVMDLIGSGFARKILFHVIQSNIKVSSSLDRTTTPRQNKYM